MSYSLKLTSVFPEKDRKGTILKGIFSFQPSIFRQMLVSGRVSFPSMVHWIRGYVSFWRGWKMLNDGWSCSRINSWRWSFPFIREDSQHFRYISVLDCNVDPKRSQISKKLANSFKTSLYRKLAHQKSAVFQGGSSKKKNTGRLNHHLKPNYRWCLEIRDHQKNPLPKTWSSYTWNLVCSKFSWMQKCVHSTPKFQKIQQKKTEKKPQTQAFGI